MSSSLAAPLLPGADNGLDDSLHDDVNDEVGSDLTARGTASGQPSLFVWLLTLAAGISGLLFGCACYLPFVAVILESAVLTGLFVDDTGVISATLVSIGTSLSDRALTSLDKAIITSCTALFALLISPFSSVLADTLGRKRVILLADILFVLGAVTQALSGTVAWMVAGRCAIGAGVGAASFVVPLYIAEVAPAAYRGRLVTMNVVFVTLGQVVAYIIGWLFAEYGEQDSGWRWMVGLGAVPAVAQSAILIFMPESPRWLVRAGRSSAARTVILRVSGDESGSARLADAVIKQIELEVWEEETAKRQRSRDADSRLRWLGAWRELLTVGRNRRALAIACLLQGLQQLCGFVSAAASHKFPPLRNLTSFLSGTRTRSCTSRPRSSRSWVSASRLSHR